MIAGSGDGGLGRTVTRPGTLATITDRRDRWMQVDRELVSAVVEGALQGGADRVRVLAGQPDGGIGEQPVTGRRARDEPALLRLPADLRFEPIQDGSSPPRRYRAGDRRHRGRLVPAGTARTSVAARHRGARLGFDVGISPVLRPRRVGVVVVRGERAGERGDSTSSVAPSASSASASESAASAAAPEGDDATRTVALLDDLAALELSSTLEQLVDWFDRAYNDRLQERRPVFRLPAHARARRTPTNARDHATRSTPPSPASLPRRRATADPDPQPIDADYAKPSRKAEWTGSTRPRGPAGLAYIARASHARARRRCSPTGLPPPTTVTVRREETGS